MPVDAKRPSTLSKKRHRFQRVEERVANLQTELQLHVKSNANELSLSFQEELGLQGELTTIESFQVLYRKLQPLCTTTPQLLHHLKKIVKLLTAELQAEPVADIQRDRMVPVLKLITALARELRREFYPHFAGVLPHIVAVIDTKDPELSTQVFKTLTMLFNFLRVQLLKDMDAVHKCYFPLLGHPKPFVRDFAAQTLSVLLRRIDDAKDLRKYLTTYLRALARGSGKDNEILRDGSAKLFFALIKNVGHGFHSRMSEIFVALLGSFRPKEATCDDATSAERELVCDIVSRTSEYMVKHTDAANAHEMLDSFTLVLEKMISKGDRHSANDLYISRIVTMLLTMVKHKSAKLITPESKNVSMLHNLCATLLAPEWILMETSECLREAMMRLFEVVWRLVPAEQDVITWQIARFVSAAKTESDVGQYWRAEVLAMVERALLHSHVSVDFIRDFIFPSAMQLAADTLLESPNLMAFGLLVGRLGAYVAEHEDVIEDNSYVMIRDGQRFLTLPSGLEPLERLSRVLTLAQSSIENALSTPDDETAVTLAWKMVRAAALVDVPESRRAEFAAPLLRRVEAVAKQSDNAAWRVLRAELWRVQQIAALSRDATPAKKKRAKSTSATVSPVWQMVKSEDEQSFSMLSALAEYLKMQSREKQRELLPTDLLDEAEQLLGANLRAASHSVRLVTLNILSRFDRLSFIPSEDVDASLLEGECDLLDHALAAESLCASVSVDVEREIVRHITRVKILSRSKQTPLVYKKLAVHFLHGLYHVKFATLWPHVAEAIAEIVSLDFAPFWPSVRDEMWAASTRSELTTPDASEAAPHGAQCLAHLEKDATAAALTDFRAVCRAERGELDASQVTDTLTHHNLLWKGMEKFVDAIETKTKFFVPVFLLFLRDQYARVYADEIDEPKTQQITEALVKSAAFEVGDWIAKQYQAPANVTTKAVRQRTLDYLRLFAAFKNMKGAFANGVLHDLFFDLFLMKADDAVSKLALQCMYGFGKKHLSAYKTQLNRIADATTFRDELTTFHIAPEAGIVLNEHRTALLPVLMRLLYAKAVSKKGRNAGDTVGARRAAILSYLAALPPSELIYFIELVVRAFDVNVYAKDASIVDAVTNVEAVQQSRVLGFLNLLEDLVAQLGVHLTTFVPTLADIVLAVLSHNYRERDEELAKKNAQADKDADAEMEMEEDDNEADGRRDGKTLAMRKQIRTLAFRRLSEIVDKYDCRVDVTPWVARVLGVADDAILHLPGAVVGAAKPSALLQFVVSVSGGDRSRRMLSEQQVKSVISSLASGLSESDVSARGISPDVLGALLQFLTSMLDGDEAEDASASTWQLIPHIPFVLEQFVARFQSKAARYAQERYAGSSKRELVFLCRVSLHLGATPELQKSVQQSAFDLFQLLLPFLQRNHHSSTTDMENILQVLAQLVPLLSDPKRHVAALAKLLAPGPNGLNDRGIRARLVDVFGAIGETAGDAFGRVASFLRDAHAFDVKKIEEIDFEKRLEALSQVNSQSFAEFVTETPLLTPVVAQYLQCMHESEYTLRSSALTGITTLVRMAAETIGSGNEVEIVLLNVLESLIMPCVRFSVRVPSEDVRRGFVLLLATLADYAVPFQHLPYVPSDLALLRRADDVEVDFFYNLTHIQVHRKRRALQRLSALMKEMADKKQQVEDSDAMEVETVLVSNEEDEDADMEADATSDEKTVNAKKTAWFSNSTVNNLLLPLVLHFIYEAQAKSQESLRHEAAICVGTSAGLLGWSHYLALLRRLLKSIDGHAEMEVSIIAAICAVIDHHHFTNTASAFHGWQDVKSKTAAKIEDDVQHNQAFKVQDQMEAQVLPMLKRYLFKAVTAKGAHKLSNTTSFDDAIVASKDVVVRVPLALAVVKVLRRLRASAFYLEFPKLLVSFIKLLKSKQEDVRSSARVTLVKIVDEMGTAYLLPIVEELRHTLQETSTHVLAYTLHVILEKVSTIAEPKKPRSLLEQQQQEADATAFASDLDSCLPSILEIIVEDLFQGVVENQDGSEYKSKMKEAKSSTKSYDALELLMRSVTFLPNTSVHEIVSGVVHKFQEHPENAKSIAVLQEALRRIALGLVKNAGVEKSYVYLYAYNVMEACLEAIRPMTEAEKAKYKAVTNAIVAWQVSEKSDAAVKQLAKRVSALDTAKVELQSKMTGFNRHEIDDVERQQSRTHLDELLSYAAYLLFAFVRSTSSSESKSEEAASLVDPLVPLLMRCASESKNNRAVVHALKCLGVLLNTDAPLPSLDIALQPLVDRLFKILQKAGAATRGNDMVQTCYRTLTVILRHKPDFRLTEAQLRVIVSFVRADLDETDHQNATYALLKSIIASRLVIPEIYDVVVRVGEILVQSDTQSARANCASIYITFLLEYPLGSKRLTQHLNFLMKNLQYEYESGRRAVLDTLIALIKKLPLEIINDKAQFFLLPLVLRLANDESSICRELAGSAIATLVKRMGNQALNECLALIAKWWSNAKDKKLLATAAQVTALVLDCRPEFVERHVSTVLSTTLSVLAARADALTEDPEEADVVDDWGLVLQLLTSLERLSECLITSYEAWLASDKGKAMMTDVLPVLLLEYPHVNVRHAALRVFTSYVRRRDAQTLAFATDKKIKKLTPEVKANASEYLKTRGTLFVWSSRVSKLLEKPQVTQEMADDVLFVLSWLLTALYVHENSIPQDVSGSDSVVVTPAEDEENEGGEDTEDTELAEATAKAAEQEKQQSKTALGWVLTRLSYVARGVSASEVVKTSVFKLFAVFIHEQNVEVVQRFVVQMINPLYRSASVLHEKKDEAAALLAANSKSRSIAADEPPQSAMLAQEVLERLEQKIGATAFVESYTFVQKKLAVFRAMRREKRKRDLVNDPELAAKRKMHKNDQKKRAKQLKKRKFAVLKGTASAATRPTKAVRPGAE